MLRYSATAVAYVTDYRTPYGVDMGNVGYNLLLSLLVSDIWLRR